MFIDSININSLRVFERVYHKKHDGSGKRNGFNSVWSSQHIKNLEQNLGKNLFDRLKHKLIPTRDADNRAKSCHRHFLALERSLAKSREKLKPTGKFA